MCPGSAFFLSLLRSSGGVMSRTFLSESKRMQCTRASEGESHSLRGPRESFESGLLMHAHDCLSTGERDEEAKHMLLMF